MDLSIHPGRKVFLQLEPQKSGQAVDFRGTVSVAIGDPSVCGVDVNPLDQTQVAVRAFSQLGSTDVTLTYTNPDSTQAAPLVIHVSCVAVDADSLVATQFGEEVSSETPFPPSAGQHLPIVTGISPTSIGSVGQTVTVSGQWFENSVSVLFLPTDPNGSAKEILSANYSTVDGGTLSVPIDSIAAGGYQVYVNGPSGQSETFASLTVNA